MEVVNADLWLAKRICLAERSKIIDLEGPILADVFIKILIKIFINEVNVHIKLYQFKNESRILNRDIVSTKIVYKLEVVDVKLKVAMVGISPEVRTSHSKMAKTSAIDSLTRTDLLRQRASIQLIWTISI